MKTDLLYLKDMDLAESEATVTETGSENGSYVVVDKTPFYPQGGGQPSDLGWLVSDGNKYSVIKVINENDKVKHFIDQDRPIELVDGTEVKLIIDSTQREFNSRLHTGGELIVAVMQEFGFNSWDIAGANHFPQEARIEYNHSLNEEERQDLSERLQKRVNELQVMDHKIEIYNIEKEECDKHFGFTPTYLPAGEAIRVVKVWGKYGRPCKGTHVKNLNQIGEIKIRKIKNKKDRLVISYDVNGSSDS